MVTVEKRLTSSFEKLLRPNTFARIGEILAEPRLEIVQGNQPVLSASVEECLAAWKRPFAA